MSHRYEDCTYPAGCTGCVPADGLTFEQWMDQVDRHIAGLTGGLGHLDLADWHYADAYRDEVTPREAAEEVLEQEGFPFE